MQARAGQVRDRGLEGIEAIIERQQRVPPKGNHEGLFLAREHRGARLLRAGAFVLDRGALLPLGDRLRVDPVALGQHPQALLTMLDRATHCRRRAGAPMQNLAHSASFHSREKSAPSKPGTKQLADAHWTRLEPLLETCRPKGKTPPRDLRRTLSAIVWRHQNGAKWRPHQALAEHHTAGRVCPVRLENPLRNVQSDRVNLPHGRLLKWSIDATTTLARR